MHQSRREFLKSAAAAGALASIPGTTTARADKPLRAADIITPFRSLPGDKAIKIVATGKNEKTVFSADLNPDKQLFVASAIKTFALCEALRQADSPDIDDQLEHRELPLDESVWSLGSLTFNPPDLVGRVSERTALEAMVTRSDNTATDMIFKLVGADNIRKFLAEAGLTQTLVPDSIRALTGYVFGADNYKSMTWQQLLEIVKGPVVHPFLNDVQTLASSADDLVSYYSRALQGKFFQHRETLNEFRRILTLCDFIYLIPLPLGVSAYAKSGNADFPDFHARSIAGAIFFSGHWVYFAFTINWDAAEPNDEETVRQFFAAIQRALVRIMNSLSR